MGRAALLDVAQGNAPANTVIKGAQLLDVFSGRFITGNVALTQIYIARHHRRGKFFFHATVGQLATGSYAIIAA